MQNIHPLFVHFPIALLLAGIFCHLAGLWLKKDVLVVSSWWMQILGTLAAAITAITGLIAAGSVPHSDNVHELILSHRNLELWACGLFTVIFFWRLLWHTRLLVLYFGFAIVAVFLMTVGAYSGGRLVYEFGVGGSAVKFEEHHKHVPDDKDEFDHDVIKKDSLKSPVDSIQKSEHHPHVYACPMHPEIMSDKPGKCTKCGMALELKEQQHEH